MKVSVKLGALPGTRRAAFGVAASLGAMLGARAADAQVLQSLFPSYVAGVGAQPANAVLGRHEGDDDNAGVQVGGFTIRPLLQESLGFDENPNGSSSNSHPSALVDTNASVDVRSNWSRNSVETALGIDDQRYLAQPNENQTNWTALLAGTYDIGSDQLGASYTHLNLNQSPQALDSVTVSQPLQYRVDQAQVSYTVDTGSPLSLVPEFDVQNYNFDNLVVPGSIYGQAYRDRLVTDGVLTARYALAPLRNVVAVVRGTHITYTANPTGLPSRDSNGVEFLAGLDFGGAGLFRYEALAGYQVRDYENSQFGNLSAPVVEAAVTWTPTLQTTVRGTLRRDIEEAADENVAGYTLTAASLDVDHELRRDVLLHAHGDVGQASLQGTTGVGASLPFAVSGSNQTIYDAGADATWLVDRYLRVNLAYTYTSRTSGAGGGAFSDNVAMLSFSFGLFSREHQR